MAQIRGWHTLRLKGLCESPPHGLRGRVSTVLGAQLLEQVCNVLSDCVRAEPQLRGDLSIAHPARQEPQYCVLTIREISGDRLDQLETIMQAPEPGRQGDHPKIISRGYR